MNDLFEAARTAYDNAHAPYSGFKVGAAIRTGSGRLFAGANVENASYPEGNCAEASAIAAMVVAGERTLAEVAVVAAGERLCTPCGGCRQRLAEFAGPDVPVHLFAPERHRKTLRLAELLPYAFVLDDTEHGVAPSSGDDPISASVRSIRERAGDIRPTIGLILGSGLGHVAEGIEDAIALDYGSLPGFPTPGIEGHGGRLVLGKLEGMPVACLQGRVHLYEGIDASAIKPPLQVLKALGCKTLIVTNAAGSLKPQIGPGSLVLIRDHINMLGRNPLIGTNENGAGPRFPDMTEAYDPRLRARMRALAGNLEIGLHEGVYLATLGPNFETPAEIKAFGALGADLVGMSTVPEVIVARYLGLKVLGVSIVTNLAAGMGSGALSHEQTLTFAKEAGRVFEHLLRALMKELNADARHPG